MLTEGRKKTYLKIYQQKVEVEKTTQIEHKLLL